MRTTLTATHGLRAIEVKNAVNDTSKAYSELSNVLHLTSRSGKEVIETLALIDTYVEAVKEEMKVRSCV